MPEGLRLPRCTLFSPLWGRALRGNRHILLLPSPSFSLSNLPLVHAMTGPVLLVVRGSSAVPVFEKVQVPSSDPSTCPSFISLEPSISSLMISNGLQPQDKSKPSRTLHDVTVLGPESLMGSRPASVARGMDASAPGSSRKRAGPEDEAAPSSHDQEEQGERVRESRLVACHPITND